MQIPKEVLDYAPLPADLSEKWKQALTPDPQKQAINEKTVMATLEKLVAEVKKLEAVAQLDQAKAQEIIAELGKPGTDPNAEMQMEMLKAQVDAQVQSRIAEFKTNREAETKLLIEQMKIESAERIAAMEAQITSTLERNRMESEDRLDRERMDRDASTKLTVAALAKGRTVEEENLCQPAALVIGGGVSGMTAALAIAGSGYDVHLVERTEMLGGNLNNLYYVAEGYDPQRLLRDLINRVRAHRRINVHTRTEIMRHTGHVGNFRAELETRYSDGSLDQFAIEHGVTIVATGGRETREHAWLDVPRVITQRELEELIVHHTEKIAALKDVVMIQCVVPDGMPEYCSRVCCTNTMKNAIRIKLFNPACRLALHVLVLAGE